MKIKKFLIQVGERYVDGHDGEQFELTNDRKTAWRMNEEQAKRRLVKIRSKEHPSAEIVNA